MSIASENGDNVGIETSEELIGWTLRGKVHVALEANDDEYGEEQAPDKICRHW